MPHSVCYHDLSISNRLTDLREEAREPVPWPDLVEYVDLTDLDDEEEDAKVWETRSEPSIVISDDNDTTKEAAKDIILVIKRKILGGIELPR